MFGIILDLTLLYSTDWYYSRLTPTVFNCLILFQIYPYCIQLFSIILDLPHLYSTVQYYYRFTPTVFNSQYYFRFTPTASTCLVLFQIYPYCIDLFGYPAMFTFHGTIQVIAALFVIRLAFMNNMVKLQPGRASISVFLLSRGVS